MSEPRQQTQPVCTIGLLFFPVNKQSPGFHTELHKNLAVWGNDSIYSIFFKASNIWSSVGGQPGTY